MKKTDIDQQRNAIKEKLKALFGSHAGKDHLLIDQLFFLNAKDAEDKELAPFRDTLINVAFDHPSWGEPMPTKFVPLELQLAKQASDGNKILSMRDVQNLNNKNEEMSLQPNELDTFLKVQHALGKLIYFDEDNLREYVVTDPTYLIDVLRSIVTEKLFWPTEKTIQETFKDLSTRGIIKKSAILQLWQQDNFKHLFPFRDYMFNMLLRLDIMIEAKTKSGGSYFIVPSMITDWPFLDTFKREKCIFLAYKFTEQIIPPALLYRFLGSFIALRNLNADSNLRLFTDSAVVTIDSKHKVQAYVENHRIILALMHEQSISDIEPSIASTVQQCLTRSIEGTTAFYCAIANTSHHKNMRFPFIIEFGVPCNDNLCFVKHNPISTKTYWRCSKHKIRHDVSHMSLWFSDKEPIQDEECAEGCKGLDKLWLESWPLDRHLMRLGALLNHEQTKNVFIHIGCENTKWENLDTEFGKRVEDMHFHAFRHWRESAKSAKPPTFEVLLEALNKNEIYACLICRVVRDIKLDEDFSVDMMAWIPDDATLEELSHNIGDVIFRLGIELELSVIDLQNIERKHKNLIDQTREVLHKWREGIKHKKIKRPVEKLAKSLNRIGKNRIVCLCLKDIFESKQIHQTIPPWRPLIMSVIFEALKEIMRIP